MNSNDADYLMHYGVKGMQWGVRRKREKTGVTRKQNRQMNREARNKFYEEKNERAVKAAVKDNNALIKAQFQYEPGPAVYTGRQFVSRLESGQAMRAEVTALYATPVKDGYQLHTDATSRYKRTNYRYKE